MKNRAPKNKQNLWLNNDYCSSEMRVCSFLSWGIGEGNWGMKGINFRNKKRHPSENTGAKTGGWSCWKLRATVWVRKTFAWRLVKLRVCVSAGIPEEAVRFFFFFYPPLSNGSLLRDCLSKSLDGSGQRLRPLSSAQSCLHLIVQDRPIMDGPQTLLGGTHNGYQIRQRFHPGQLKGPDWDSQIRCFN